MPYPTSNKPYINDRNGYNYLADNMSIKNHTKLNAIAHSFRLAKSQNNLNCISVRGCPVKQRGHKRRPKNKAKREKDKIRKKLYEYQKDHACLQ